MAPKDGLEQPTTGEEPVDEPFAEADEVEFVTSRYYLSIVAYSLKKFRIFFFNSSPPLEVS